MILNKKQSTQALLTLAMNAHTAVELETSRRGDSVY